MINALNWVGITSCVIVAVTREISQNFFFLILLNSTNLITFFNCDSGIFYHLTVILVVVWWVIWEFSVITTSTSTIIVLLNMIWVYYQVIHGSCIDTSICSRNLFEGMMLAAVAMFATTPMTRNYTIIVVSASFKSMICIALSSHFLFTIRHFLAIIRAVNINLLRWGRGRCAGIAQLDVWRSHGELAHVAGVGDRHWVQLRSTQNVISQSWLLSLLLCPILWISSHFGSWPVEGLCVVLMFVVILIHLVSAFLVNPVFHNV